MSWIESGAVTLKIYLGNFAFQVTRKFRGDVETMEM